MQSRGSERTLAASRGGMQVRQAKRGWLVRMGGEHAEERAHDGRPNAALGRSREAAMLTAPPHQCQRASSLICLIPVHCSARAPPQPCLPMPAWILPLARPATSAALIARKRSLTVLTSTDALEDYGGAVPSAVIVFASQTCRRCAATVWRASTCTKP